MSYTVRQKDFVYRTVRVWGISYRRTSNKLVTFRRHQCHQMQTLGVCSDKRFVGCSRRRSASLLTAPRSVCLLFSYWSYWTSRRPQICNGELVSIARFPVTAVWLTMNPTPHTRTSKPIGLQGCSMSLHHRSRVITASPDGGNYMYIGVGDMLLMLVEV